MDNSQGTTLKLKDILLCLHFESYLSYHNKCTYLCMGGFFSTPSDRVNCTIVNYCYICLSIQNQILMYQDIKRSYLGLIGTIYC